MSDSESKLKVETPIFSLDGQADEDTSNFQFSAFKVVNIEAALSQPSFKDPKTLKNKALKSGKNNKPPQDAKSLTSDELDIVLESEKTVDQGRRKFSSVLSDYRKDMAFLETRLVTPRDMEHIFHNGKTRITNSLMGKRQELKDSYEKYLKVLSELKFFKETHGLVEGAKYQDKKEYWRLMVAFLIFEVFINSYVFMSGSDIGLLGGAFMALLVSIMNVGTAAVMGLYILKYIHHKSQNKRLMSILLSVCMAVVNLASVFAIAHYRDLLQLHENTGDHHLFMDKVLSNPLTFNYAESIVFLVVTSVIFVAALYKSYKKDDRYPGYGDLDRVCRHALYVYQVKKNEAYDEIKSSHDRVVNSIYRIQNNYRSWFYAYKELPKVANDDITLYESWKVGIQKQCNSNLKAYREYNKSVRINKAPDYFDEYPNILAEENIELMNIDPEVIKKAEITLGVIESQSDDMIKNVSGYINKIGLDFDSFITDLEDVVIDSIKIQRIKNDELFSVDGVKHV